MELNCPSDTEKPRSKDARLDGFEKVSTPVAEHYHHFERRAEFSRGLLWTPEHPEIGDNTLLASAPVNGPESGRHPSRSSAELTDRSSQQQSITQLARMNGSGPHVVLAFTADFSRINGAEHDRNSIFRESSPESTGMNTPGKTSFTGSIRKKGP